MVFLALFQLYGLWKMFSLIWNFGNIFISAIWSIFYGPNVDHITGTECISFLFFNTSWGQYYQGAGRYLCIIDTWFLLCTAPTCTAPVHNRNVKPILHRGLCELVLCIIGFAVRLRPSVCRHWTNFLLTQHISGDFLVLIWFLFNSMLWSIHRGARFSCAALGVKGKI